MITNDGVTYASVVLFLLMCSSCVNIFILLHFYGLLIRLGDLTALISPVVAEKPFLWALVSVAALIDNDAICLLPWKATSTCCRLQGIPTLRVLMTMAISNIIRSAGIIAAVASYMTFDTISLISLAASFIQLLISVFVLLGRRFGERLVEDPLVAVPKSEYDNMSVNETSPGVCMALINAADIAALEQQKNEEAKRRLEAEIQLEQEREQYMLRIEEMTRDLMRLKEERLSRTDRLSSTSDVTKAYKASVPHPDENLDLVKRQVTKLGIRPLEYMPLAQMKAEVAALCATANSGSDCFDEDRLDYLLQCMELNREYIAEQEEQARLWREKSLPVIRESLQIMRGYLPADKEGMTVRRLTMAGLSTALAKRLFEKKCLWLLRTDPSDIAKMHGADLCGMYSYDGQQLDVIELCAVYGCLIDVSFESDIGGRKQKFRSDLEAAVKRMLSARESGTLDARKQRNAVYKNQSAPFTDISSLWHVAASIRVRGADEETDRDSLEELMTGKLVSSYNTIRKSHE
jgi:hypothetical protein